MNFLHPKRMRPILIQPNKFALAPPLDRQLTGLGWPLALLIAFILTACAGTTPDAYEDPFAPKIFKEDTVVPLPTKPPNAANLIPFYVSQHSVFKFAIDPDSIRLDPDGVTRYVLVITSPSGSQQVNFEGIRCETFQFALYATLNTSAIWQANQRKTWTDIKNNEANRYHGALAQGAFCNNKSQVKNKSLILDSLQPSKFTGKPNADAHRF